MPTKLYMLNQRASRNRIGVAWSKKISTGSWVAGALSTSKGSGVTTSSRSTVAGPTAGIEWPGGSNFSASSAVACWISEPLDADVTISGTITVNIWAAESNMAANVALNCDVYKLPADSDTVVLIVGSARNVEVAVTTRAVNNFTLTPTSTACNKGDRLMIVPWMDDSTASMGAGETCNIGYGGTTDGADGDSYVQFDETLGFLTTAPSGSTYYLRSLEEDPVVSGRAARSLITSRGSTSMEMIANWIAPSSSTDHDGRAYCCPVRSQYKQVSSSGSTAFDSIASTAHRNAQGFKIASDGGDPDVRWIYIPINVIGPDDDPSVSIHNDSSGDPGTVLATCSAVGYGPNNYFTFPGTTLTATTQYHLVLRNLTGVSFQLDVNGNTANPYANGNYSRSTNSGSTWTPNTSNDMNFGVAHGYPVDFYTPALAAQTLSGLVKLNIRAYGLDTVQGINGELAVCNGDGTSATVWGRTVAYDNASGNVGTTDAAATMIFAGDDLSISANQRIRIRLSSHPAFNQLGTISGGHRYMVISLDGPSASAAGDSYLTFSQTINEAGAAAAEDPFPYIGAGYYG